MNGPEPFSQIIARLQQDPQHAARQAAATGQRVVGYVGHDVPVALILASGALPVRLRGHPDAGTSHADEFVESSFAPDVRAIAAQWLRTPPSELDFWKGP